LVCSSRPILPKSQIHGILLTPPITDDSCQVIFDLPFCSDVAYAVPSNSSLKTDNAKIIKLYDDLAAEYYRNFTNSLAQIACDTTGTARYSLARDCNDCKNDYKTWLCSVIMPRCEDFSADGPGLQARALGLPFPNGSFAFEANQTQSFNETVRDRWGYSKSRNPIIDTEIKPGPYKELLPCEDLCFDIVRSCPAMLGFSCPNDPARSLTYGKRSGNKLTCNFPGAAVSLNVDRNGAVGRGQRIGMVGAVSLLVAWFLWL